MLHPRIGMTAHLRIVRQDAVDEFDLAVAFGFGQFDRLAIRFKAARQ